MREAAMAGETDRRYELGRLVLDYIRTFMWPAVLLLIALFYWEDLISVVKERQVSVFGVEIGPAVERLQQVEATTQQELQDVAVLVEALNASYQQDLEAAIEQLRAEGGTTSAALPQPERAAVVAQDIDAKLSSLQQNLDREVQQIQESVSQAPPGGNSSEAPTSPAPQTGGTRADRAAVLERTGFEAILRRDLPAALKAFTEARMVWSDYHNVAEIQRYLAQVQKSSEPLDDAAWARINRIILTEYSWGMPADVRGELRTSAAAAY